MFEVTGVLRPWHADREAYLNSGEARKPLGSKQAVPKQNEGTAMANGSSDRPIVIGDGRAVHMAKGWAEDKARKALTRGHDYSP